eukprot:gene20868-27051_t
MIQPMTIYSDDEIDPEPQSDSDVSITSIQKITKKKSKKIAVKSSKVLNIEFEDDENISKLKKEKIKKKTIKDVDSDIEADTPQDNIKMMPRTEERAIRAKVKKDRQSKSNESTEQTDEELEAVAEAEFFEEVIRSETSNQISMFSQLNLSRPLLRAIESAGYVSPTPVQAEVIPLALVGRDVCASAVTGSGKTAAFMLPVLERLIYRPKDQAAIRVLVITPTRELAAQIYEVTNKLSAFMSDVTCAMICGGKKDVKSQESTLRQRPDIVVCTPGRLLDHLRNSQSVQVDDLDVLVLDEVDRLLELGFQEELEEILKYLPCAHRQTLLFSATMTPKVEDLVKLSLKRPVRVKTSQSSAVLAPRLVQEFVRVRDETEREALVLSLILRSFHTKTIVFFDTKREAHRCYVLLQVLSIGAGRDVTSDDKLSNLGEGVRAVELHGDMTQTMRYIALEKFKSNQADVLICTDVAARGLDVSGVTTVISAEMPRTVSTYVHRVGRTARAGKSGRSITLVSDSRRKVMKEVLKDYIASSNVDKQQVLSRTIPGPIVSFYRTLINKLQTHVSNYISEESLTRELVEAENEANRANNLIEYADEISSRPARSWHINKFQKEDLANKSKEIVHKQLLEAKIGKEASKMLAEEKARQLALTDDYRDDNNNKPVKHRLSRIKRRRLEAMNSNEFDKQEDNNDESKPAKKSKSMNALITQSKQELKQIQLNKINPDLSTLSKSKHASGKVLRPKFATGGIDTELFDWDGKSSQISKSIGKSKKNDQIEEFKGFNELNSNKKHVKTTNSFKSKKRYKRR